MLSRSYWARATKHWIARFCIALHVSRAVAESKPAKRARYIWRDPRLTGTVSGYAQPGCRELVGEHLQVVDWHLPQ